MTWADLPPGLVLILGGVLAAVLPHALRKALTLVLPLAGMLHLAALPEGVHVLGTVFGMDLIGSRVDGLALVFGAIFYAAAFLAAVFHLHVRDRMQDVAAMAYAGAAVGAVFAGDLATLFVYWELTAIASVFLVFAGRTDAAYRAGIRYLLVQITSGVLLMGGLVLHWRATGSVAFDDIGLDSAGAVMIFLAFGIKCGFPLLHGWIADAYPRASITGAVFLSAFTTKLAVYALARGFPGTELLVWIGAAMGVLLALLSLKATDIRRILAYSLNSQLGIMVAGVGIGTPLALDGVAAHAVVSILYTALLFMAAGVVLHRTGRSEASALGGLATRMPWTLAATLVAAATISALPLTGAFVSKSPILTAAGSESGWLAWSLLLLGAVGAIAHTGLRLPWLIFAGRREAPVEIRQTAPANMYAAMAGTAALCIAIGLVPGLYYGWMPNASDYEVYSASHVLTQLQLVAFAALGFVWLVRSGLMSRPAAPATLLDADWFYRRGLQDVWRKTVEWGGEIGRAGRSGLHGWVQAIMLTSRRLAGPDGPLGRAVTPGTAVLWLTAMLGLYLVVFYT
ncbi:MAG: hypothetical protein TEF_07820 [Rhizobiales bacterium NRL2]|jgi:multicomponent Na+:H+ antiporter subunit D|nr:MAG: hypothetical protein TEF_07820 [Rhizobiales bacterium NRL2]